MNLMQIKAITIPEGKAVKILQGTTVLWSAAVRPEEEPIINLIDTVGITTESRLSSSGAVKSNSGTFVTGLIADVQVGDIYRTSGAKFYGSGFDGIWCYRSDDSYWTNTYTTAANTTVDTTPWKIIVDDEGNLEITIKSSNVSSIRLCGSGNGSELIVTKNQEIK